MATPLTSRDYLRAARQRLETADFLLNTWYTKDGMYLAGYTIECALKALILERTPAAGREAMFERISSGGSMHDAETLNGILKGELGLALPLELVKRCRRSGWTTNLRYEAGRADSGEARGVWKTAKAILDWVQGKLP